MKKTALIVLAFSIGATGFAQDKTVTSAKMALNDKDYEKAKSYINQALQDPSTKDNAKTWATRAEIYGGLMQDVKNKDSNFYRQVSESYLKVVALKPDYQKQDVNKALISCAYMYFNDAVENFNDKKYSTAYDLAEQTIKIHDLDGGKRLAEQGGKKLDTVAGQAKFIAANSAFTQNKYDEALPLLQEVAASHIMVRPSIYMYMSEIYNQKNKPEDALKAIEQGRKEFPEDKSLRNEELNYYLKSGKQNELIKKLEDAVAKEPNNPDLVFDLGTEYMTLAQAKEKPANADELMSKAEVTYLKAISLSPDNSTYNYNLGALYFNQGVEANKTMNDVPSKEQKRYDDLKAKRDALFNKASPYLEKSYNSLDARSSKLNPEDKQTYISSMMALASIYGTQSKMDKANELKAKAKAFH